MRAAREHEAARAARAQQAAAIDVRAATHQETIRVVRAQQAARDQEASRAQTVEDAARDPTNQVAYFAGMEEALSHYALLARGNHSDSGRN